MNFSVTVFSVFLLLYGVVTVKVTKLELLVQRGKYHKTTPEDCTPLAIMTPLSAFVVKTDDVSSK